MNYLIALASNRTKEHLAPFDVLSYAVWLIGGRSIKVTAQSRFFVTPAAPEGSGPDHLRIALAAHSDMDPPRVAEALRQVEAALSGGEGSAGPAARGDVVCAQLLACADRVLPNLFDYRRRLKNPQALADDLVLPHPDLHECPALLAPLADIAPDWMHPVFQRTVREMLAALPGRAFERIAPYEGRDDTRDVAE